MTQSLGFVSLDLFPSSGEGREILNILDPLEGTNLTHSTMDKFQ
jgi:hypothetical protein